MIMNMNCVWSEGHDYMAHDLSNENDVMCVEVWQSVSLSSAPIFTPTYST